MIRHWKILTPDKDAIARLSQRAGISKFLAWILLNRGITTAQEAKKFLSFALEDLIDDSGLEDFAPFADLLAEAILVEEKIGIYGDYDVDGITATSLLLDFLTQLGLSPEYYLPHRLEDGYGLSISGVEELAKKGIKLLVAVDCGIKDFSAVQRAKELGLKVLIIDHHQPAHTSPPADLVLDPHLGNFPEQFKILCSAGLVFFLLLKLRQLLREKGYFKTNSEPNLKKLLDLVALGTVADVAPAYGLNRILLAYGFKELENTSRFGLRLLKKQADLEGEISYGDVAFRLAPRLNSAGRIDEPDPSLEILLCTDPRRANQLAQELERRNQLRQRIEEQILNQAIEQIESWQDLSSRKSLVVWGEGWHPGVVGIVAQRLRERYFRPAVVLCVEGELSRGSARGIEGLDLYASLVKCQDYLLEYGGHKLACGLSLHRNQLEHFREAFEKAVSELASSEAFQPTLFCDAELPLDQISPQLLKELDQLRPFGPGNPTPVLVARAVKVVDVEWRKEKHLRMVVQENRTSLPGWYFRAPGELKLKPGEVVDLVYQLDYSSEQGRLRLLVQDLKKLSFR